MIGCRITCLPSPGGPEPPALSPPISRQILFKNLELVRMPGKLGTLQAGAFSDAIVVDGNPLKDLALLGDQGKHLSLIMKAGILHKNQLT